MKSFKKIFLMLTSFAMVVGTLLIGGGIKKTNAVEAAETTDPSKWSGDWNLVEDDSTLTVGDQLIIASNTKNVVAGDISNKVMGVVEAKFSDDKKTVELTKEGAVVLTLGGVKDAWTLSNSSNKNLGATASKNVAWDDGTTTWKISIDKENNNNVTINNTKTTYGRFLHNVSSTRFTTYTSDPNTSMLLPQIYRFVVSSHIVKFVTNGGKLSNGDTTINDVTVSKDSKIDNPGNLTHLTDNDKKFMGWYYTDSEGLLKEWNFATDKVTSDLTLTAKWGYEVTINPDNGKATETKTVLEGTKISEVIPTEELEKPGFKFDKWKKVIGTEVTDILDEDVVTSKLEIRAIWMEITTPLVFVSTENEIHDDTVEYYVDQEFTLSAVVQHATVLSYTWEISEDESGNPVLTNLSGSLNTKDIKFKANKIGDVIVSISASISESGNPLKYDLYVSVKTHPVKDIETKSWLGLSYVGSFDKKTVGFSTNYSGPSVSSGAKDKEKNITELFELKNESTDLDINNFVEIKYFTNDKATAYYKKGEIRLYCQNGNGSSLNLKALNGYNIKSISISVSGSGLSFMDEKGNDLKSTDSINLNSVVIQNKNSGTSGNIAITNITITLEKNNIEFTNIRARFGITIPANIYQFDEIKSENISFKVYTDLSKAQDVQMADTNKTVNEDGSITYVVSVTGIPLENCKDVIHVVPTIIINGHSYELTGTAYSVYEMVNAYLEQEAFKDNEYLNALKDNIDAVTDVA